ncbi:MAG TPA: hypothetical protein PLQ88_03920, partial [Blastocatellia bacterium]|nr:hypothetical protein [Blastocatellia bacterium]
MKTAKTPQTQRVSHRSISLFRVLCVSASLWLLALTATAVAQSGRATVSGRRTITLHVLAQRVEDPNKPKSLLAGSGTQNEEQDKVIPKSALELFDGGVRQKIEAFAPDPTPARIVVLMDNSLTLQADVSKLASVPAAFAPEIYEGDKVMVIGYDLKPEIITDFTDEPKQLQ